MFVVVYPLSVLFGFASGARHDEWTSILWSAGIGAALAILLSLALATELSFQFLLEFALPASAICAGLGAVGAVAAVGSKALLRALRWVD
jgi:hypothetical protein